MSSTIDGRVFEYIDYAMPGGKNVFVILHGVYYPVTLFCRVINIRAFGITGDWKTMALKAEVWVEAVTEGGRRFMAAWREEEEDAARHHQEKREATRLGKLQSHTEA